MRKATKYLDRDIPNGITFRMNFIQNFTKKSVAYKLHNQNTLVSVNVLRKIPRKIDR